MATDAEIRATVLDRMIANYAQPKHVADPTLKAADYLAVLRPFEPATLTAAWAAVVSHHRFTIWPEPAVIAQACRQVEEEATRSAAVAQSRAQQHAATRDMDQRQSAADGAMRSALGQEALRDGWSRSLWQAVYEAGALSAVGMARIDQMRTAAARSRAGLAASPVADPTGAGGLPTLGRAIASLAAKMADAEARHAARFREGQP